MSRNSVANICKMQIRPSPVWLCFVLLAFRGIAQRCIQNFSPIFRKLQLAISSSSKIAIFSHPWPSDQHRKGWSQRMKGVNAVLEPVVNLGVCECTAILYGIRHYCCSRLPAEPGWQLLGAVRKPFVFFAAQTVWCRFQDAWSRNSDDRTGISSLGICGA